MPNGSASTRAAFTPGKEVMACSISPGSTRKWYAENYGLQTRFAQAVMLRVPAKLTRKPIEQALEALHRAHPALRARVRDTSLTIPPLPLDFSAAPLLHEVAGIADGTIADEAEVAFAAASTRLDPASGIMLQAVHGPSTDKDGWLMLVIHHLVTDGVSWRIILTELETACLAAMAGTVPFIAREEASIRDWAKMLGEQVPVRQNEQELWRVMLTEKSSIMPRKLDATRDTYGSALHTRTLIDTDLTRLMLNNLPAAYHMTVEETILTAVTRAFSQVFAVERLRFALESGAVPVSRPAQSLAS
ncbi:MAG: condensation domain-containing protein [Rickettsia endosymbiont of Ixodes persulcatus]|nr:condensation domain-containing protein [Rickettsia endosymbiont of Ixodes persulcatus]